MDFIYNNIKVAMADLPEGYETKAEIKIAGNMR